MRNDTSEGRIKDLKENIKKLRRALNIEKKLMKGYGKTFETHTTTSKHQQEEEIIQLIENTFTDFSNILVQIFFL